jgi:hypothetical protein
LLHQLALSLSLELTILKQLVILQQNSFCLWFEDLWILLPVLLLLLLSSSVASERERTEENKQTKNRRKQMTIARLITKELTTPQLLLLLCALPRRILVEGAKAHLLLTCSINLTG